MAKIKVLVIDDSALIRSVMKEIINAQPDMEVVGAAADAVIARDMIRQLNPDVITLDIEMPRMDGLDFLERLMNMRPIPVLMVSSLTDQGSEITMRALELGAVDFVSKPKISIQSGMREYADLIADKIRATASANVRNRTPVSPLSASSFKPVGSTEKVVVMGASTGGTEAIKDFLIQMPPDAPGILVVQHMPEGFTHSFAQRLNSLCRIAVAEAQGNERIQPGHAFIAPGHSHLTLQRNGKHYYTRLEKGPPVNRHRPSVDVLFDSAARNAGRNAIGVILTGMGKDGALGMRVMRDAGGHNFAQDEASSIVYGMPREAVASGGVHEQGSIKDLPRMVLEYLWKSSGRMIRH